VVEPPGVPDDGGGEFALDGGLGGEIGEHFGLQLFEARAVFVGEGGDLAGEVVADGVETDLVLACFGRGAGGFFRVFAVCGDLFVGCHFGASRFRFRVWRRDLLYDYDLAWGARGFGGIIGDYWRKWL